MVRPVCAIGACAIGACAIGACIFGWAIAANAAAGDASFDTPLKVVHVALPPDKDNPDARPEVRCSYYARYMVKEIDLGEIGAYQLSIVPAAHRPPACRKANGPDEKIVSADDWTGYFKAAAGDYIFFDAEDGWNGGLGFAVFTPGARKLFDDVAKGGIAVIQAAGQYRDLAMRYRRVYGAKCSLGGAKAAACWKTIAQQTGIDAPMPDCRALYAQEQKRTPKLAQQVLTDPAVVEYDVVATLSPSGSRITAVAGHDIRCAPQE